MNHYEHCPRCGSPSIGDSRFCLECGADLAYEAADETPESRPRNTASPTAIRNALLAVFALIVVGALGFNIVPKLVSSQDSASPEASAPDALGNTTVATNGDKDDPEESSIEASATSDPSSALEETDTEGNTTGATSSDDTVPLDGDATDAPDSGNDVLTSSGSLLVNDPAQTGPDGYVLPQSDTHRYTESELSGLDLWGLSVARNEIPARHGFIFERDDLVSYFEQKTWYKGVLTREQFRSVAGILNETENANVDTILEIERAHNSPYVPQE